MHARHLIGYWQSHKHPLSNPRKSLVVRNQMPWGSWFVWLKLPTQTFVPENINAVGKMLHEAWQVKKQMTSGICSALIDEAYQAAIDVGAEGGKLLGAGGGGFLMFLAPPQRHDAIRRALKSLRETPFRFAPQGSNIIFVH
jgi:galactokinase/mevalonate kinase-like predicted kinase